MLGFAGVCNIINLKSVQQVLYELSKLSLNGEWLKAKTNTKDSFWQFLTYGLRVA